MLLCVFMPVTYLVPQNMKSLTFKIDYDNLKAYSWIMSSNVVVLRVSEKLLAPTWSNRSDSPSHVLGDGS